MQKTFFFLSLAGLVQFHVISFISPFLNVLMEEMNKRAAAFAQLICIGGMVSVCSLDCASVTISRVPVASIYTHHRLMQSCGVVVWAPAPKFNQVFQSSSPSPRQLVLRGVFLWQNSQKWLHKLVQRPAVFPSCAFVVWGWIPFLPQSPLQLTWKLSNRACSTRLGSASFLHFCCHPEDDYWTYTCKANDAYSFVSLRLHQALKCVAISNSSKNLWSVFQSTKSVTFTLTFILEFLQLLVSPPKKFPNFSTILIGTSANN